MKLSQLLFDSDCESDVKSEYDGGEIDGDEATLSSREESTEDSGSED